MPESMHRQRELCHTDNKAKMQQKITVKTMSNVARCQIGGQLTTCRTTNKNEKTDNKE